MEVEKTNFVTHLIITVQLYYRLSKNSLLKFCQISFKWCKFTGKSNERILRKLIGSEN